LKLVIQRVRYASVEVRERKIAEIGGGLLVFVGIGREEQISSLEWLVKKTLDLRIFEDDNGRMNLSLREIGGEILLVSQFTLYADCSRGRRPGFDQAAEPEEAAEIFDLFVRRVKEQGIEPQAGEFGADMQVRLLNDGPVTIVLER
jgi:D-aminoacyl-tRNA deacylase